MDPLSPLNSAPIVACQLCGNRHMVTVLFLGHMPSVNSLRPLDAPPTAELRFPLALKRCTQCQLVQIGYDVDQRILFPHTYPYLSGSTAILKQNFNELASEVATFMNLKQPDFILDIGANDGTLLWPFKQAGYTVLGVEPSQAAQVALDRGIPMIKDYFNKETAKKILAQYGQANVITAANVFAHITDVHALIDAIQLLLPEQGIFVSENHYLLDLVRTVQYDTIYHEHLRYYSLTSLTTLFESHGLEIIQVKPIPTHGGSLRVYAARKGRFPVGDSVKKQRAEEEKQGILSDDFLTPFQEKVVQSKLALLHLLTTLKQQGARIYGIGAPSRASTLINYVGLDDNLIDCILEISTSPKLNQYMPGTQIKVLAESKLYAEQPEYALLFSWHIADELIHKLRQQGYQGQFIIPLPSPQIIQ